MTVVLTIFRCQHSHDHNALENFPNCMHLHGSEPHSRPTPFFFCLQQECLEAEVGVKGLVQFIIHIAWA